jgi:hypothetical protein
VTLKPEPGPLAVATSEGICAESEKATSRLAEKLKRAISALWKAGDNGDKLWKTLYDAFVTPLTLISAAFGACAREPWLVLGMARMGVALSGCR